MRDDKPTAMRGHSDKSNGSDQPATLSRRISQAWISWTHRAAAHAVSEAPSAPAAPKPKDPKKVAAGKARAAQAAARRREAAEVEANAKVRRAAAAAARPRKTVSPMTATARALTKAASAKSRKGIGGVKPQFEEAMVVVAFRVTPKQKRKLAKLGNGSFIRDRIDRATLPAKK